jgi:cell division protein ZapA
MPQVSVMIAGRPYRMACGEGEEEHLQGLARRLDGKIADLRGAFGEIGDQRITVMAALTIADDLAEAEKRIAALRADIAALHDERQAAEATLGAMSDAAAAAIDEAAAEVDRVASGILGGVRG